VNQEKHESDAVEQDRSLVRSFDFEEGHFTGPVYKRLMRDALSFGTASALFPHPPDVATDPNRGAQAEPSCSDDDSVENQFGAMNTVLHRSESLSLSSKTDLEMLRKACETLQTPPLRHEPMANLIVRERTAQDQLGVDLKYLQAASTYNADDMADALDASVNLNSKQKEGDLAKMHFSFAYTQ
jgi:hypothetical protein